MHITGKIMSKRSSHTGKSSRQKDYYFRKLDMSVNEPTVEDEPIFPVSDNPAVSKEFNRESTIPTQAQRGRPTSPTETLIDHLKKNWINWLVLIIVGIVIFFATTFSRGLGTLEGTVGEIKEVMNSIRTSFENLDNRVQEQEFKLREQDINIENIEEDLQDIKSGQSTK